MVHLVWEGAIKKGDCRIIRFEGEELGTLTVCYDEFETRGVTFRVFRTVKGEILIHKHAWEHPPVTLESWASSQDRIPATEERWAFVYAFPSVESAADAGFHGVLKRLDLV